MFLLLFWVVLFVSALGLKPSTLHLEDKRSISLFLVKLPGLVMRKAPAVR